MNISNIDNTIKNKVIIWKNIINETDLIKFYIDESNIMDAKKNMSIEQVEHYKTKKQSLSYLIHNVILYRDSNKQPSYCFLWHTIFNMIDYVRYIYNTNIIEEHNKHDLYYFTKYNSWSGHLWGINKLIGNTNEMLEYTTSKWTINMYMKLINIWRDNF